MQDIYRLINGSGTGIRTKVLTPILLYLPSLNNPRVFLIKGNLYIGILFVIPKEDIILRSMLFNQIGFQNQSFYFIIYHNIFKFLYMAYHASDLEPLVSG